MRNHAKLFWFITFHTKFWLKPLRVSFDKVKGFIRVYDGTRYLALFGHQKYNAILNRIRYLIGVKSGITCYYS